MNKSEAVSIASQKYCSITMQNSNFANINAAKPVWWIDPTPNEESERWFLLHGDGVLYVLRIPSGTLCKGRFRQKGKLLSIEISVSTFVDVKSGGTKYDFRKNVIAEIDCA
ncbi:hypothetical protein ACR4XJ_07645 [Nitratidesulfovibrio sp. D1]|uniref:hypothetical protein n=1 Tax=Nitratidesulfovibrio sp. D1 TaxID=3440151 RepID=UPI003EBDD3B5